MRACGHFGYSAHIACGFARQCGSNGKTLVTWSFLFRRGKYILVMPSSKSIIQKKTDVHEDLPASCANEQPSVTSLQQQDWELFQGFATQQSWRGGLGRLQQLSCGNSEWSACGF